MRPCRGQQQGSRKSPRVELCLVFHVEVHFAVFDLQHGLESKSGTILGISC